MNMDLLSAEKASAIAAFVTAEMLDSFTSAFLQEKEGNV